MLTDYFRQLKELFIEGEILLKDYNAKNALLVEKLDFQVYLFDDDIEKCREVTALRSKTVGENQPYSGIIKNKIHAPNQLLTCLFTTQAPVHPPAVVQSVAKKADYSYLKSSMIIMIMADCTKKELIKLGDECTIWLEKSLTNEEDQRLVWTSVKSVLDSD